MEYRQLGRSGLRVSAVGLGCNNFGGAGHSAEIKAYGALGLDETREVVNAAFDSGVTFFDTADVYGNGGSEQFLGQILADRRDEVVIATKWGSGQPAGVAWGSRRYIRRAVEASLRRLQSDHIDLYQMHWPDPLTPLVETLAALQELVTEGKVRYLGSSHFSGWEIVEADWLARTAGSERLISAQNHYNLLERSVEDEVVPACTHAGVGLLPYFPLASGLLTGKYTAGDQSSSGRLAGKEIDSTTLLQLNSLAEFAGQRGRTMLELAIAGLAARPAVASVITGATTPAQINANAAAVQWRLSDEEIQELDGLLDSRP